MCGDDGVLKHKYIIAAGRAFNAEYYSFSILARFDDAIFGKARIKSRIALTLSLGLKEKLETLTSQIR